MLTQKNELRLPAVLAGLLFLLACMSAALADQITLSYIDAESNAQTLSVAAVNAVPGVSDLNQP